MEAENKMFLSHWRLHGPGPFGGVRASLFVTGDAGIPLWFNKQRNSSNLIWAAVRFLVVSKGDHNRSAAAAARGQMVEKRFETSTNSLHMHTSPPRTRACAAGSWMSRIRKKRGKKEEDEEEKSERKGTISHHFSSAHSYTPASINSFECRCELYFQLMGLSHPLS